MLEPVHRQVGPVVFRDLSKNDIISQILNAKPEGSERFAALNAHALYLAEKDSDFCRILNESITFCDGFGIHLLALVEGRARPKHRNTPTDFLPELLDQCAREGKRVYFLGDVPEVVSAHAHYWTTRHPRLVVGWHDGFFELGSNEERAILDEIQAVSPDLLCLGMGMPRQEKWAWRHREELRCGAILMIGASMAFAVGHRKRGPAWATNRGLEWFFRVLSEPRAMFARYFVEIPVLILGALRRRVNRGPTPA